MTQGAAHQLDFQKPSGSPLLWRSLRAFVHTGDLKIRDWKDDVHEFGDKTGKTVAVHFRDARIERALLLDPQLAIGEGYMDGVVEMETGTIFDFLSLIARNIGDNEFPGWMGLADKARQLTRLLRQTNTLGQARRNVSHHYDLPGSLYDLFLDKDKQYSCAYFPKGSETLEEAQLAKKRHIANKLCLSPGHSVLDIGCGWGGLSLHLAREAGARVLGITLSQEQERYARARAEAEGRNDVSFCLCDYRTINGSFDRIVSVGMFEHVGVPNYRAFFRKVNGCLKDSGIALLHTIGRLSGPGTTNPFIAKYIFPGGYSPALSEIVPAIEKSGLIVTDIEVLRLHYAETLAQWRRNFENAWGEASSQLSERFCRMWQFYLAGCEVGFRYHNIAVFQIQLAKRLEAVPLTRDYLYRQEKGAEQAFQSSI
ncbi:MAG: cyclopropane-fatty-acyl-phospholipid synthase family protein [Rhodomicrobium sp.]